MLLFRFFVVKFPDPWKSYIPILLGFLGRGQSNHGEQGERPRKGLFCPEEGAGRGCRGDSVVPHSDQIQHPIQDRMIEF